MTTTTNETKPAKTSVKNCLSPYTTSVWCRYQSAKNTINKHAWWRKVSIAMFYATRVLRVFNFDFLFSHDTRKLSYLRNPRSQVFRIMVMFHSLKTGTGQKTKKTKNFNFSSKRDYMIVESSLILSATMIRVVKQEKLSSTIVTFAKLRVIDNWR